MTSNTEWCWASRIPPNIIPPKHQHQQVVPRIAGIHLEHIHPQNGTTGLSWGGKITSVLASILSTSNFLCMPVRGRPAIHLQGTNATPHAFPSCTTSIIHGSSTRIPGSDSNRLHGQASVFDWRIKRANQERGAAKAPAHSLPWGQCGDANLDTQFPHQETPRTVQGG